MGLGVDAAESASSCTMLWTMLRRRLPSGNVTSCMHVDDFLAIPVCTHSMSSLPSADFDQETAT